MEQGIKAPFHVILLGIIFDPRKRKILIAKRGEDDEDIKNLTWQFPEGRLRHGDDANKILETNIKKKTGLDVKSLGVIFSKVYPEKQDFLGLYHLCESVGGELMAKNDFVELKWISPDEIEKHFETSFHPDLKEYLDNLK